MYFYTSYIYLYTSPNLVGGRPGGITLGNVLTFVTGSDEEAGHEYEIHPSICFAVAVEGIFHPTANVSKNRLTLKRVDGTTQKFPDNLFTIFYYAFANVYKGNIKE